MEKRILVCLRCGEEFKYKQGEVGKCPYCGGELAVDSLPETEDEKKQKEGA